MSVTLEVSKPSGWLNTDADCRESNGGHTMRGKVWPGRRQAAGDRGARSVQARARLQIGSRARGGAHAEHGLHVRDFGGVEAQCGWLNAFACCRETKGGHAVRDYVRTGRREAAGDRGTRSLQGRAPLQVGGGALEGAYST